MASDGAFFMIKHTPLPNGNPPILSPICPLGVADTLDQGQLILIEMYARISALAIQPLKRG